ncbi:MAG TPA: hypothetical protein VFR11_21925 [Micromonosporaceae bacterium]|nr:hypothetical protein [Micromonosporaceae bacterium]
MPPPSVVANARYIVAREVGQVLLALRHTADAWLGVMVAEVR